MPRNKKNLPPAKEHFIGIRVTNTLFNVLSQEANDSNMSLSEYIRTILTNRQPVIRKTTEVVFSDIRILHAFRNLAGCGNNLNQIAAYLHSDGTMTNQMWKEIKDCISEIYEIRDSMKKLVGEYRGNH